MNRFHVIFVAALVLICAAPTQAQDVVGGSLVTRFSYGPDTNSTLLILDGPFNADGMVTTVTVDILQKSGFSGGCTAGDSFTVRFFRPGTGPEYALVAERGPFAETLGTDVLTLSSPVAVQRGDILGFYTNGSPQCLLGGGYGSQFRSMYIPADYRGGPISYFVDGPTNGYSIRASSSSSAYIGTLPGVGVTGGAAGAAFHTLISMVNPSSGTVTLSLAFHPTGASGASPIGSASVTLGARSARTVRFADLFPQAGTGGLSGIGSIDVYSDGAAPALSARVYNDSGAGTNGFTESLAVPNSPQVAHDFDSIWLTMPADFNAFRMNIGVRALGSGALMTCEALDASGSVVASTSKSYPGNWTSLESLQGFFGNNAALTPGGSIRCLVGTSGAAKSDVILYGTVTDNRTNDSALFFAERH